MYEEVTLLKFFIPEYEVSEKKAGEHSKIKAWASDQNVDYNVSNGVFSNFLLPDVFSTYKNMKMKK